ncbi:hypothetical protein SAMD00023353_0105180 [Rosellinia necatrix]|uniref:Uncharacterized protein n=1 Tax=Rosellinia necatrix TaxID=77044 RepID=A0A1S8A4U1_ROSNE|nr:hypothetical protein SAMD00023353_0105180 [Rosellinia necatrix]
MAGGSGRNQAGADVQEVVHVARFGLPGDCRCEGQRPGKDGESIVPEEPTWTTPGPEPPDVSHRAQKRLWYW